MQSRSNVAEGLVSNTNVLATKSGSKHQPGVKQPIGLRDKKKISLAPREKSNNG